MSRFLLDTHVLLWWAQDPNLLADKARYALADGRHLVFVSAATIWELGIKRATGKLSIPQDLRQLITGNRFDLLAITAEHAEAAPALPPHHRDPFDRMLVAQAILERLTLVTRDAEIGRYGVPVLAA